MNALSSSDRSRGFSLVELAIVLAVVSILLGTLLSSAASFLQRAKFADTEAQIRTAIDAVLGFAYATGRLPCPDTDGDGLEDEPSCAGGGELTGTLPNRTLGISGRDPWGEVLVYAVDADFADDQSPNISFNLGEAADLIINATAGGNEIAQDVALVIYSRGPNQYSGTTGSGRAAENENNDGDDTFVSRTFSDNPSDTYDDVLDWVSANVLKAKMVEAGKLP